MNLDSHHSKAIREIKRGRDICKKTHTSSQIHLRVHYEGAI